MAYAYSRVGDKNKAIEYYDLAVKYFAEDHELLIEYAQFLEAIKLDKSIEIYQRVLDLHTSNPDIDIKPEFYNNFGVTLLIAG
jgi:tetratricopeptide (TPR) repeat protein